MREIGSWPDGASAESRSVRVAGIDGTKGGWVAVELLDGRVDRAHVVRPIDAAFETLSAAEIIAIDVPIGFGPREADGAARKYLGRAASTVFTTPTRQQLDVPFGPGLGVSAQAHALGSRIIHVTALATADQRIREVHPEVSFRAMNSGAPLQYRKKSYGGGARETRASSPPRSRAGRRWSCRRNADGRPARCSRGRLERSSCRDRHRALLA